MEGFYTHRSLELGERYRVLRSDTFFPLGGHFPPLAFWFSAYGQSWGRWEPHEHRWVLGKASSACRTSQFGTGVA
ncbi:hypothetical protein VTH06DRAFT_1715 [Thermothelomyces fergusii]